MTRGRMNPAIIGAMLLVDAIVGVALAVLISPIIGAAAFVVSAGVSLISARTIQAASGREGTEISNIPETEQPAAETADPSYNPYARED